VEGRGLNLLLALGLGIIGIWTLQSGRWTGTYGGAYVLEGVPAVVFGSSFVALAVYCVICAWQNKGRK
jgi:hypothetical protein